MGAQLGTMQNRFCLHMFESEAYLHFSKESCAGNLVRRAQNGINLGNKHGLYRIH